MPSDFAAYAAASLQPVVIEKSDCDTVLIAFGGIAEGFGMPPAEFANVTDGLPARRIFVRDQSRSFHFEGIPGFGTTFPLIAESLHETIGEAERVVVIGNSAGGTAALIVGSLIGADEILAFSPITFFNRSRRVLSLDRRWREQIDRRVLPQRKAQGSYFDLRAALQRHPPRSAQVFFPERSRLDRHHARRMCEVPNVAVRPLDSAEHNVIKKLRRDGTLVHLLEAAINGDPHGSAPTDVERP